MKLKTALTIAGSDCSGGAGIQADLKTMTMNGVYGMSAITALTAQNTTGVTGISEVTPAFLQQQIDMVFDDIRPDAVKIGMVSSAALIQVIAQRLSHYQAQNLVVDPVMVATSGARLLRSAFHSVANSTEWFFLIIMARKNGDKHKMISTAASSEPQMPGKLSRHKGTRKRKAKATTATHTME